LRRRETVKPLELFFDLVFVLGFTQCTALMAANPNWSGIGQTRPRHLERHVRRLRAGNDCAQRGDVTLEGGPAGIGEAYLYPSAPVADGPLNGDVPRVSSVANCFESAESESSSRSRT
jgi:hypothetical protein